jgi:type IV secretory pathway component VirB8
MKSYFQQKQDELDKHNSKKQRETEIKAQVEANDISKAQLKQMEEANKISERALKTARCAKIIAIVSFLVNVVLTIVLAILN